MASQSGRPIRGFQDGEVVSLLYHDIFSFPLNKSELMRWSAGDVFKLRSRVHRVYEGSGEYYLNGRLDLVKKKAKNTTASKRKMRLLSGAAQIFEEMDDIQMVAVTGSLAMLAAMPEADIDLMFITRRGSMWKSRLKAVYSLKKSKIPVRKAKSPDEADKLCLNVWMEEGDLVLDRKLRSPYTAHEIAQILPIVNKNNTYKRFLGENSWTREYWPNAAEFASKVGSVGKSGNGLANELAYRLQRAYMRPKRTRETVTRSRAFFHPFDWSARVESELAKRGVVYR